jgi:hypothetical protein
MTGISLTAGFANGALAKQVRPDTPHAPRDHRALGRETTKIFPRDLEIPAESSHVSSPFTTEPDRPVPHTVPLFVPSRVSGPPNARSTAGPPPRSSRPPPTVPDRTTIRASRVPAPSAAPPSRAPPSPPSPPGSSRSPPRRPRRRSDRPPPSPPPRSPPPRPKPPPKRPRRPRNPPR